MRKVNPENCDYLKLGSQTVYMQWAFINESLNFNGSYQEQTEFDFEIKADEIINKGVKPMHFIDFFNFPSNDNHTAYTDGFKSEAFETNVTIEASGTLNVHWQWKEMESKGQSSELVYASCGVTDLGDEFKNGDKLLNRIQMEEHINQKETYTTDYSQGMNLR